MLLLRRSAHPTVILTLLNGEQASLTRRLLHLNVQVQVQVQEKEAFLNRQVGARVINYTILSKKTEKIIG